MKRIKDILIGILIGCLLIGTTPVLADTIAQSIEVVLNSVKVQINGEDISANTILYNGTTYLPMRAVAEVVGKEVEWNQSTMTANIVDKTESNVELPTIISHGFDKESYAVSFSDGFTVGLDTKKNQVPGFPTYESILVNAQVKNMDKSSIISTPIIIGSDESGNKYDSIGYNVYSVSIPEEYKEGFRKLDFYESFNSKYTDSFGGTVYFESYPNLYSINYDDGVHKCTLYLND